MPKCIISFLGLELGSQGIEFDGLLFDKYLRFFKRGTIYIDTLIQVLPFPGTLASVHAPYDHAALLYAQPAAIVSVMEVKGLGGRFVYSDQS